MYELRTFCTYFSKEVASPQAQWTLCATQSSNSAFYLSNTGNLRDSLCTIPLRTLGNSR